MFTRGKEKENEKSLQNYSCLFTTSGLETGAGLQVEILKNGLNPGVIAQFRSIVHNHSDKTLKDFLVGLLGVLENG